MKQKIAWVFALIAAAFAFTRYLVQHWSEYVRIEIDRMK